jgi:hypothetical protein
MNTKYKFSRLIFFCLFCALLFMPLAALDDATTQQDRDTSQFRPKDFAARFTFSAPTGELAAFELPETAYRPHPAGGLWGYSYV